MGYFTEQIAQAGLIGIGMTNAPACVSPPGGTQAVLGTNPMSMSVPAQAGGVAFQFDQSTSAIAIGKIRVAAAAGEKIPLGWAVDKNGQPTDDPKAALAGSLVSAGGYKGYGFGLMAEVLAAALTGSLNSVSAPPLKTPEGPPHDLGQFYFLLDPTLFAGEDFWQRLDCLVQAVSAQPNARLPGSGKPFPMALMYRLMQRFGRRWKHLPSRNVSYAYTLNVELIKVLLNRLLLAKSPLVIARYPF